MRADTAIKHREQASKRDRERESEKSGRQGGWRRESARVSSSFCSPSKMLRELGSMQWQHAGIILTVWLQILPYLA